MSRGRDGYWMPPKPKCLPAPEDPHAPAVKLIACYYCNRKTHLVRSNTISFVCSACIIEHGERVIKDALHTVSGAGLYTPVSSVFEIEPRYAVTYLPISFGSTVTKKGPEDS